MAAINGHTIPHLNGNELHSNDVFDRVKSLNGKPSVKTEGFTIEKTSDSLRANIEDGDSNIPILAQTPNLYKQNGAYMSKIPYNFNPIPDEFLIDDFIDDPIMMRFIRWMFKRIKTYPTTVPIKHRKMVLELEPFEFMYGRSKCAEQAGISLKQAESRLGQLVGQHMVSKVGSKSGSTFSVYRLVTTSFIQNSGQQVGQHFGQHFGQQVGHNLDIDIRSKKKDRLERLEEKNFDPKITLRFEHETKGHIEASIEKLESEFLDEGWSSHEIHQAINKMNDFDPRIRGSIKSYLKTTLMRDREEQEKKKSGAYTKRGENKNAGTSKITREFSGKNTITG